MTDATVSVVVPHFNSTRTIERALASVAHQTIPAHEVIVVDDASKPDERTELVVIAERSTLPVRVVYLDTNSGPGVARNVGWELATGTYVAFLDADDTWIPEKLELQVAVAVRRADAHLVCHSVTAKGPTEVTSGFRKVTYNQMLLRNRVATSSALVRRSTPNRFPALRYSEDYALWLDIVHQHEVVQMREVLGVREKDAGGLSTHLWRMECGELGVLRAQRRLRRVAVWSWIALSSFSLAKHCVRVARRFT